MVQYRNEGLRAVVLGLILGIQTGCSSSQVGSTDMTPETLAQAGALPTGEAATNEVPPSQAAAPGSLDASANPPPLDANPAPAELATQPSEIPAPVSGEVTQYKVKRGDTLMKIAFEKLGDLNRWKDILASNSGVLSGNAELKAGMVLNIEGAVLIAVEHHGEIYLIKKGDTLGLISKDVYGTQKKWKRLWDNNRDLIKNPNRIYAGFNLYYIPEAKLTEGDAGSGASASNQPLPFKGQAKPSDVARGPVPGPYRVPSSVK
jgi:nucleoid-associated protein YgaU